MYRKFLSLDGESIFSKIRLLRTYNATILCLLGGLYRLLYVF